MSEVKGKVGRMWNRWQVVEQVGYDMSVMRLSRWL
jgi:hypothetical protein